MLMALNSGKIDAAFYDQAAMSEHAEGQPCAWYPGQERLQLQIGAGFNRDNGALREQFNAFLKEIRSNGTYDDMMKRWVENGSTEMPRIRYPEQKWRPARRRGQRPWHALLADQGRPTHRV